MCRPPRALSSRATRGAVIKTVKFGTILVIGKTLYTLKPIRAGCTAACVKFWSELLLPKGVMGATAGPGVNAAKLGTVRRAGGKLEVTYAGKALYFFKFDTGPGKVTDNVTGKWGTWSDVATIKPASSGGGTTTAISGGSVGF